MDESTGTILAQLSVVEERMAALQKQQDDVKRQVQTLQGSTGLSESLSLISGWNETLPSSTPPIGTFIGQGQVILAGYGATFSKPANTGFLRIAAGGPLMNVDYVVDSSGHGTHTKLFGSTGALQAAISGASVDDSKQIWVCATHRETVTTTTLLDASIGEAMSITVFTGGHMPDDNDQQFTINLDGPLIEVNMHHLHLAFEGLSFYRTQPSNVNSSQAFIKVDSGVEAPNVDLRYCYWEFGVSSVFSSLLDVRGVNMGDSFHMRDCIFNPTNATAFSGSSSILSVSGGSGNFYSIISIEGCDLTFDRLIDKNGGSTSIDAFSFLLVDGNKLFVNDYALSLNSGSIRKALVFSDNTIYHTGAVPFIQFNAGEFNPRQLAITGNSYTAVDANLAVNFFLANMGLGTVEGVNISGNHLTGPSGASTAIIINGAAAINSLFLNSYYNWGTNISGTGVLNTINGNTTFTGTVTIPAGSDIWLHKDGSTALTGNWNQTGVFDITTAGNFTAQKHGAFGSAASIASTAILTLAETVASAARGIDITLTTTGSGIASTVAALGFSLVTNHAAGTLTQGIGNFATIQHSGAGIVSDLVGSFIKGQNDVANGAITRWSAFFASSTTWSAGGAKPTTTYAFRALDQGIAGVATAYGLSISAQTGTNARSFIADALVLGTDAAPPNSEKLTVRGGSAALLSGNTLRFYPSGNAFYTEFKAAVIGNNLQYILPLTDPTAGQILSSTAPAAGVATLSWIAPSAGGNTLFVDEDGVNVDTATRLNFIEPDAVLVTDSPAGTARIDVSKYFLLAGRSGGQTAKGGTAASETLTLMSTAHATKGTILFGTSTYDEANNALVIGSNALVTSGDAGSQGIQIVGATRTDLDLVSATANAVAAPGVIFERSRGTIAVPTTVQTNDNLGFVLAYGWQGAAYGSSATIQFSVDAAVSGIHVPSRIVFKTSSSSVDQIEALRIDSGQNGLFAGAVRVGASSAPTNTTAGDLTAIRGMFGPDNSAFAAADTVNILNTGLVATSATGLKIALTNIPAAVAKQLSGETITLTMNPTDNSTSLMQGLKVTLTDGGTGNMGAHSIFTFAGDHSGSGTLTSPSVITGSYSVGSAGGNITGTLRGALFTLGFAGAGGTSTITALTGVEVSFAGGNSVNENITTFIAYNITQLSAFGGASTTRKGLNIPNLGGGTATDIIGIDIAAQTVGSGVTLGIRNAAQMRQTGYLSVLGTGVVPSNATDGDVSGIRLFIAAADTALLTGLRAQVAGVLGISDGNTLRFYNATNTFYDEFKADGKTNNIQYMWPMADPGSNFILPTEAFTLIASRPVAGVSKLSWIDLGDFAKLTGRDDGQILFGGSGSEEFLTFSSTEDDVKGFIQFGDTEDEDLLTVWNEQENFWGIGTTDPSFNIDLWGTISINGIEIGPYSYVEYVFAPDAAPQATVVAGNQQGNITHSGPNPEVAMRLYIDAETAPGASGLPITLQYGDTDSLDTVTTWTTIATLTLSSLKSSFTDTMTTSIIPAKRLLRMNVGTIVGSPADVTATLVVKRPLTK